ncbi:MAG: hypothetical protein QGG40_17045, partial [Myxococcota bacterium]|nr:hypothetical protein [Myxococcota bacterium]
QVVLEEIGVLYAYPDDPLFRETLEAHGIQQGVEPTLAVRDYVRVNFVPEADEQEADLKQSLGLVPWGG